MTDSSYRPHTSLFAHTLARCSSTCTLTSVPPPSVVPWLLCTFEKEARVVMQGHRPSPKIYRCLFHRLMSDLTLFLSSASVSS